MARREVIEIPGLGHSNPIPLAVKIGSMVFSGGIMGQDPATGKVPSDPERQVSLAFENMQKIVEAAGAPTVTSRRWWCTSRTCSCGRSSTSSG